MGWEQKEGCATQRLRVTEVVQSSPVEEIDARCTAPKAILIDSKAIYPGRGVEGKPRKGALNSEKSNP